jgi:adenylate cyclase class IV
LDSKAKNLGKDDKDVYFFIIPDKLLKVVNNISQKNARIVLKLNKIGKGSDFEELEIPIQQDSVTAAIRLFKKLGLTDNIMRSFQKRHNFLYKGVEIALKYSKTWGYHAELEIVINNSKKKESADKKIVEIAEELKIRLMPDKELREFTRQAEARYKRFNRHSKRDFA